MKTIFLLFLFFQVSVGQFFNLPFGQISSLSSLPIRLTHYAYPDGLPDALTRGCNHKTVVWARLESNLPTIHYPVNRYSSIPVRIGKCNRNHKDMQWAKLITNIGERFLNVNENHLVTFNGYLCFDKQSSHGVKIITEVNPTCPNQKQLIDGVQDGCGLKKIQWAKVESNLGTITLQVNKDHVIGRCSPQYPTMQWARLETNAGSKDLDMKVDNEIKFNNKNCRGEKFGAEIIIHRDCKPDKFRSDKYQKMKRIEYSL